MSTGETERLRAELETAGWWIDVCPDGDLYGQLETDSGLKEFRIDPATLALLTRHTIPATAIPDAALRDMIGVLCDSVEEAAEFLSQHEQTGYPRIHVDAVRAWLEAARP